MVERVVAGTRLLSDGGIPLARDVAFPTLSPAHSTCSSFLATYSHCAWRLCNPCFRVVGGLEQPVSCLDLAQARRRGNVKDSVGIPNRIVHSGRSLSSSADVVATLLFTNGGSRRPPDPTLVIEDLVQNRLGYPV